MENALLGQDKKRRQMSCKELTHLSDNLFEQAVEVNAFWNVMNQFKTNTKEYRNEMNCSVAFYNFVYHALAISVHLTLAKLYDKDSKSLSLFNFVNGMTDLQEEHLDPKIYKTYKMFGDKFQHRLKPIEESLFEKEVQEEKEISQILGYKYLGTTVELSLQEYIKLYQRRFKNLKKKDIIKNLTDQRNRIIAHNDTDTNFDYNKVFAESPITDKDIEILIDFALDCTQFVRGMLTGIHTVPEYTNIDDWSATLNLVKIGKKYQQAYKEELIKEMTKERK